MNQPLTTAQLTELRALLHERREELQGQMVQNRENLVPPNPEQGAVLQRNEAREVNQALTNIDMADLARIDHALSLMDSGGYGECDACGCNIPFERLKIEPQTQHCVACKSKWESEQAAR